LHPFASNLIWFQTPAAVMARRVDSNFAMQAALRQVTDIPVLDLGFAFGIRRQA